MISPMNSSLLSLGPGILSDEAAGSTGPASGSPAGLTGITVDKSVEFSYEELATATDNFNLANKIGEGGFGSVYYAELRGEVCCHNCYHLSLKKTMNSKRKVIFTALSTGLYKISPTVSCSVL